MVVEKLLAAHFNVVQAMSGAEALDIISNSSKPPDFVLLDVMMPKMSGLEVLFHLIYFVFFSLIVARCAKKCERNSQCAICQLLW